MVSRATLTVLFGYMAAFSCLQLLPEAGKKAHTAPPQSTTFPRLAAGALLLPAAVATFGLSSLLLYAYVSAAAAAGAGAGRRRFVDRLASATAAAAATVALLLLVTDDVDWLNAE
ncbi:hypothetical protein U9M48_029410 [Paspalum notatum var. saurae]|uniref:Uncharacterized protein n=1 Tax=Paspalum notatum var. saurae TaxID=547442 RepID=A0AAQ3X152_PASNO